jgi:hypothetical protein
MRYLNMDISIPRQVGERARGASGERARGDGAHIRRKIPAGGAGEIGCAFAGLAVEQLVALHG